MLNSVKRMKLSPPFVGISAALRVPSPADVLEDPAKDGIRYPPLRGQVFLPSHVSPLETESDSASLPDESLELDFVFGYK